MGISEPCSKVVYDLDSMEWAKNLRSAGRPSLSERDLNKNPDRFTRIDAELSCAEWDGVAASGLLV